GPGRHPAHESSLLKIRRDIRCLSEHVCVGPVVPYAFPKEQQRCHRETQAEGIDGQRMTASFPAKRGGRSLRGYSRCVGLIIHERQKLFGDLRNLGVEILSSA